MSFSLVLVVAGVDDDGVDVDAGTAALQAGGADEDVDRARPFDAAVEDAVGGGDHPARIDEGAAAVLRLEIVRNATVEKRHLPRELAGGRLLATDDLRCGHVAGPGRGGRNG